jgi:hypothetical protein
VILQEDIAASRRVGPYGHALDAVRGDRALDQGVLAEHLEPLRRLAGEELLLAAGLAEVGQVPRRDERDALGSCREESEGIHAGRGIIPSLLP